jgi:hypothetical protein
MEVKELKESFQGVMPLIEELHDEKKLLMIKGKDNLPKIVYHFDPQLHIVISDEFKTKWNQTFIAADMDIVAELKRAGLKPMEFIDTKKITNVFKFCDFRNIKRIRGNRDLSLLILIWKTLI